MHIPPFIVELELNKAHSHYWLSISKIPKTKSSNQRLAVECIFQYPALFISNSARFRIIYLLAQSCKHHIIPTSIINSNDKIMTFRNLLCSLTICCGIAISCTPATINHLPEEPEHAEVKDEQSINGWLTGQKQQVEQILEATKDYQYNYQVTSDLYKQKDHAKYKYAIGDSFIFRHSRSPLLQMAQFNTISEHGFQNLKWQTVFNVSESLDKPNAYIHSLECIDIDHCLIGYKESMADKVSFVEYTNAKTKFESVGGDFFNAVYLNKDVILFNEWIDSNSATALGWPKHSSIWFRNNPTEIRRTQLENPDVRYSYVRNIGLGQKWIGLSAELYSAPPHHTYLHNEGGQQLFKEVYEKMSIRASLNGFYYASIQKDFEMDGKKLSAESIVKFKVEGNTFVKPETVFECNTDCSIDSSTIKLVKNGIVFFTLNKMVRTFHYFNLLKEESKQIDLPHLNTADELELTTSKFSGLILLKNSNPIVRGVIHAIDLQNNSMVLLEEYKSHFDTTELMVELRWTKSKDGTPIPYHIARHKNANKNTPTMMRVYGASRISNSPYYSKHNGSIWLAKGYSIVWPHTRGGGEFGDKWYEDGRLLNKHNVYDDINAVAENVIRSEFSSAQSLAIMGGSAGGLSACMSALLRPELYAAVLCAHPFLDLTDTKNVDSDMVSSQYGSFSDPDFKDYLKKYSPIYNIKDTDYPPFMIFAATDDTRLGAIDSRRFVKKMQSFGKQTLYVEVNNVGHTMGLGEDFFYNWTIVHTFLEHFTKVRTFL
jgi:prolyl oligopeptidase